jgi:hypothetical protein
MLQSFIEIVVTQRRQASHQMGREQTLDGRPGPLYFLNTLCSILALGLTTWEVVGWLCGCVVLSLGVVVFLSVASVEWNEHRARQGIINGVMNMCNAKMCGRRCW